MVAMTVWPTDGADGSVATEARWRKMGRHWTPSGVLKGVGGEMGASLSMPNLTIRSGAAWVDGHYTELTSDQVLAATANGIAVVRFDPAANTAELVWRDGVLTPAQNPTGVWELVVAKVEGSVLVTGGGALVTPSGSAPAYGFYPCAIDLATSNVPQTIAFAAPVPSSGLGIFSGMPYFGITGIYLVTATVSGYLNMSAGTNLTASLRFELIRGGVAQAIHDSATGTGLAGGGVGYFSMSATSIFSCNFNDYLAIKAWQGGGGSPYGGNVSAAGTRVTVAQIA